MSLVETMVTLGVASGLVLGVMEAVNMSARSVKSVQTSNDWTTLIGTLRLMTQSQTQCGFMFNGLSFPGGPTYGTSGSAWSGSAVLCDTQTSTHQVGGCTTNSQLNRLRTYSTSGTPVATLLDVSSSLNGIRALQINLKIAAGNATETIPVPNGASGTSNMYRDLVELEIYAKKQNQTPGASGSVLFNDMSGAQSILYAGNSNNRNTGIIFQVLRNTTSPYAINGCFGTNDQASLACSYMGGVMSTSSTASPRCQLSKLPLQPSTTTVAPPDSAAPNQGQRLSLLPYGGTWGAADPRDYAVGIDSANFWFNAGDVNTNKFQFTNAGGGQKLAEMTYDTSYPNSKLYVGTASSGSPLILSGGTRPMLSFGGASGGLYGPPGTSSDGEKIQLHIFSAYGRPDPRDAAMGVDVSGAQWTTWFTLPSWNAGSSYGQYQWYDADWGTGALRGLMNLNNYNGLTLQHVNPNGVTNISFNGTTALGSGTEYIMSCRGAPCSGTAGRVNGLELVTGNVSRFMVANDGNIYVGGRNGDNLSVFWFGGLGSSTGNAVYGGPGTPLYLNSNTSINFRYGWGDVMTITNGVTINAGSGTGNVPHAMYIVENVITSPGYSWYHLWGCGGSDVLISGFSLCRDQPTSGMYPWDGYIGAGSGSITKLRGANIGSACLSGSPYELRQLVVCAQY